MKRKWKKILLVLSVGFVVWVVAVVGSFIYAFWENPYNDREFDRAVWLSTAPMTTGKNPRGPMAEDLRSRYLHVGMLKNDVRKLLGAPDSSSNDQEQNVDKYLLGNWEFMSIDGDYLVVHYDKSGRLKRTEIYTD